MIFSKVARVRWTALSTLVLLAAAIATSIGCSRSGAEAADGRPTVVATTTQVADLARTVGGRDVHVVGMLAPNADPHEHEVRPADVRALTGARLVVRSGGDVDRWLDDAIASAGSDAPVLTLLHHVRARRDRHGVDPHWWQDPRNGIRAVAAASWRSAWRTSGRRRSSSAGSPTGPSGGAVGIGAALDNSVSSAPGSWPKSTPSRCRPRARR